jgi:hypothetical protein
MSYKINPKKLESCMIELFSESGWGNHIQTKVQKVLFLTSDGQLIMFPNIHEHYSSEESHEFIRDYASDYIDETVWEFFYEAIDKPTMGQVGWHSCIVMWSLGLYLDRYHRKEILESNGKTPVETIKEIVWDYFTWKDIENNLNFINPLLERTRTCRLLRGEELVNTLNIESYHPLTHSQRSFILDYIESYHISTDKIYIDDWSEEQSIKRQLGLQFL